MSKRLISINIKRHSKKIVNQLKESKVACDVVKDLIDYIMTHFEIFEFTDDIWILYNNLKNDLISELEREGFCWDSYINGYVLKGVNYFYDWTTGFWYLEG